MDDYQKKYLELQEAVRKLYYGCYWKSDRLTGIQELRVWADVRRAAGFEAGKSFEALGPPQW